MRKDSNALPNDPGRSSSLRPDGTYLAGLIRGLTFLFVIGMTFLAVLSAQSLVRLVAEYEVKPPPLLSSNARTTCISMRATHAWVCNTTSK